MRTLISLWLLLHAVIASAEPIRLSVDLRDAPRHVFHVRESIDVVPGPLALRYPKWIPGEHSPTGPIADLTGLRIESGATTLAWTRDPVDMYVVRVDVPGDVKRIDVAFDYLLPTSGGTFTDSVATTAKLAMLSWNTVVLYPSGIPASDIVFEPSISLPGGWQAATALRERRRHGDRIDYAPVSLETLIDSPLAAGAHYRAVTLEAPPDAPEHVIHLVADSDVALGARREVLAAWNRLVPEAYALFGAHHYRRYDFLLALSDRVAHFGLEHHESSENRLAERTLVDEDLHRLGGGLLPHEFVHSWNAKYRRPDGLATRDFETPMVGDLLWVYEGLTEYWGEVLTARSGARSLDDALEALAWQAAELAHVKGREWRPLGDTARAAQNLYGARGEGTAWRRGTDFYGEGALVWLEVDAMIRTMTNGARSLDDFARAFFGPPDTGPEVKPYTRADLVAALNAVAPYDWEAFFETRVDAVRAGAPVEGIEAAGWTLVYDEKPNAMMKAAAADPEGAFVDLRFSLGLLLSDEGEIADVVPQSAAAIAGAAVGAQVVAVNSRAFSEEVMTDALDAAKANRAPLELLLLSSDYYSTVRVDYRDGQRHPHLVRDASKPDLLTALLTSRVTTD